ncbi:aryl-sulfate sulfotransferase [Serratia microhaemolytica]|uniref:aryl-sulfate sulfotransferase n=1 Tax=Serratia microhaemolytica TaxID=2675110 RepID=UPI000FDF463D|nr:aryl-sulfate sulfotransferase [Serratia microhaemolytica]
MKLLPSLLQSFRFAVLVLLLILIYPQQTRATIFIQPPQVVQNPNPAAPLVALVKFVTDTDVETTIDILSQGSQQHSKLIFDNNHDPARGLPILGLRQGETYTLKVTVLDATGKLEVAEPLQYTVPVLPHDIRNYPPLRIEINQSDKLEPGFTIVSARREIPLRDNGLSATQWKFNRGFGMLLAFDNEGDVVWSYTTHVRIAGITQRPNGNIVYTTTDARIVEIDMLGNVINQWHAIRYPARAKSPAPVGSIAVDTVTLHHQPTLLPNGNILVMSAYPKLIANYYSSETDPNAPRADKMVMGDVIVEFAPDGRIVWQWNSFENLDPFFIGHDSFSPYWSYRDFPDYVDWSHGNSLSFDEKTNSVVASFRNLNAVVNIDRSTGKIRWVLTDPIGVPESMRHLLLKAKGEVTWPYAMHNPRVTEQGTLLMWVNGNSGTRPFDGRERKPVRDFISRILEYKVDASDMTVQQVWSSDGIITKDNCLSAAMGETYRLPQTGNTLLTMGLCLPQDRLDVNFTEDAGSKDYMFYFYAWTGLREFDNQTPPNVLRDIIIDDPQQVITWQLYGGFKTAELYPNGIVQSAK